VAFCPFVKLAICLADAGHADGIRQLLFQGEQQVEKFVCLGLCPDLRSTARRGVWVGIGFAAAPSKIFCGIFFGLEESRITLTHHAKYT
jgi:hypothetical protein